MLNTSIVSWLILNSKLKMALKCTHLERQDLSRFFVALSACTDVVSLYIISFMLQGSCLVSVIVQLFLSATLNG